MLTKDEQALIDAMGQHPIARSMDLVLRASRNWLRIEAQHETSGAEVAKAMAFSFGQAILEVSLSTGVMPSDLMKMIGTRMEDVVTQLPKGGYAIRKG